MPNCRNNALTHVPVTGNVDDNGGCKACLSPAPMENLTCGPPGGGTFNAKEIYHRFSSFKQFLTQ